MAFVPVPVDNKRTDWPRLVANAINYLMRFEPREGQTRYSPDNGMEYFDGTEWQPVP